MHTVSFGCEFMPNNDHWLIVVSWIPAGGSDRLATSGMPVCTGSPDEADDFTEVERH